MDACTESCSAVWLALVRATGLLRGDADTRALLEDNIDRCIHDVEVREEALGKQMRTVLADAKLALRRGQRVQARACASRGQRYATQLQKLRSMLHTLHAHKDMVDTTQLNMSIVGALKQTSLALTSWKKDGVVRDVSEVDQIRQELEDNMRAAHELIDATAAPCETLDGDHDDLDRMLAELEAEAGAAEPPTTELAFPSPPTHDPVREKGPVKRVAVPV